MHFGLAPYTPCPADSRWGDVMRTQWVNLTRDGRLTGFLPVATRDGTGDFRVGLQTAAAGTEMVRNYAKQRCAALSSIGLDKRFWLTN